jgi:hypothetical protein
LMVSNNHFCSSAAEQALAADRNQRASHRQLAARCSCRPAAEAQRSALDFEWDLTDERT